MVSASKSKSNLSNPAYFDHAHEQPSKRKDTYNHNDETNPHSANVSFATAQKFKS